MWCFQGGDAVSRADSQRGVVCAPHAIYQHVIDKNKIDPTKTVFIDDRSVNLTPAEQLGIKTFLFTHADQLIAELRMATGVKSLVLPQSNVQKEHVTENRF